MAWLLAGTLAAPMAGAAPSLERWALDVPAPASEPSSATPEEQALARALADYAAGRWPQAQAGFEALTRNGHALGTYNLAMMHLRGEVPHADPALAMDLLTQAAAKGLVRAMFTLGVALETGAGGKRDLVLAHDWYEQAARRGHLESQLAMGTAYYLGRGRPKDLAQAAQWYREATRAGDEGAQYLLASMYETGDGVPRDLRLARYWYAAAAAQGDVAAAGKVKELDARAATAASATAPP